MTTPIVLSLGELLWDMLPSGKRAGGAPVNFAYHAMKNGTEGWAISAVGEDELGDELIAKANEAGINTVIQRNAWPTSTVEVALKNGIPEYTIVKGVAWDHILYTRQLIDVVSKADAVCFGTLALRSPESHATITELLKHTKPGVAITGDQTLLLRLWGNLLQNAVTYGKEGGHIWMKLSAGEGVATLQVRDDGVGIAPDQLPKIWERFYQVDPARSGESSGLGLSMVRWIVQAHGGTVQAESALGEGSTFTARLPLGGPEGK